MTPEAFLRRIDEACAKHIDRAIAVLWFIGVDNPANGLSVREIAQLLQAVGHPTQNVSRLHSSLSEDRRTAATRTGGWSLRPAARRELDSTYREFLSPLPLPTTDSVVPMSLVANTRGYIEKVADQINKSYDAHLFDCCAVMCRRLLETLIIELFEMQGRANEIRDGRHFVGLSELIAKIESDAQIHLSRPSLNALRSFKSLGDLSAHNRHYNARLSDLEPQRAGIRQVVEELLYRAALRK